MTPVVLDVLQRQGLQASFFVLGEKLSDCTRLVARERAHKEGHWIGNHTFTHALPLGLSGDPDIAEKEIDRSQNLLGQLAQEDRLFRPFGGAGLIGKHLLNRASLDFLIGGKFTCVLWNAAPRDWENPNRWVVRVLEQCRATKWARVVLHDLPTGAMDHLEKFIEIARDEGATFNQTFPPSCVPVVRGQVVLPMEGFVADTTA